VLLVGADPILRFAYAARRWVVYGLAAGLVIGVLGYLATPPRWTAAVTIELTDVSPVVDLQGGTGPGRRLTVDTDAQILRSDAVARTVAGQLGEDVEAVEDELSVSARSLTRVLELSYRDHSEDAALTGADVAASAFLGERQRLLISPLRAYLDQIVTLTQDPGLSAGLLEVNDGAIESADDVTTVASLEVLRQEATALQLEVSSAGRVLNQARITAEADRGDIEMPLVSGAALGAMIGLVVGCIRARRAERAQR